MGTMCLLFVSKHVSVSLLFVKFRHYHFGRMKAWAACNSLDWVTCFPLHFTLAYIVYQESRTRQVVYIHYGGHGEMYIGIDSSLIDLSICCIICS